jgi:CheY-like chemotaxis protein
MLSILIVEDEPLLATTLKHLVEFNPRYSVTGIADDLASAMAQVDRQPPDLALVDLQLANGTSGFSVAARLHDRGVACLFTTGKAPGFPVPDLAIGCLSKPFEEADLVCALAQAEDHIRGRRKVVLKAKLPESLQLYSADEPGGAVSSWVLTPRRRTSLRARLWKMIRRPSAFQSAITAN